MGSHVNSLSDPTNNINELPNSNANISFSLKCVSNPTVNFDDASKTTDLDNSSGDGCARSEFIEVIDTSTIWSPLKNANVIDWVNAACPKSSSNLSVILDSVPTVNLPVEPIAGCSGERVDLADPKVSPKIPGDGKSVGSGKTLVSSDILSGLSDRLWIDYGNPDCADLPPGSIKNIWSPLKSNTIKEWVDSCVPAKGVHESPVSSPRTFESLSELKSPAAGGSAHSPIYMITPVPSLCSPIRSIVSRGKGSARLNSADNTVFINFDSSVTCLKSLDVHRNIVNFTNPTTNLVESSHTTSSHLQGWVDCSEPIINLSAISGVRSNGAIGSMNSTVDETNASVDGHGNAKKRKISEVPTDPSVSGPSDSIASDSTVVRIPRD